MASSPARPSSFRPAPLRRRRRATQEHSSTPFRVHTSGSSTQPHWTACRDWPTSWEGAGPNRLRALVGGRRAFGSSVWRFSWITEWRRRRTCFCTTTSTTAAIRQFLCFDTRDGGRNDEAGAIASDGAGATYEISKPLVGDAHDLNVSPGQTLGLLVVWDMIDPPGPVRRFWREFWPGGGTTTCATSETS